MARRTGAEKPSTLIKILTSPCGHYIYSFWGDERHLADPRILEIQYAADERFDPLRGGGMNAKQDDSGSAQLAPSLNCQLPEILI